MSINLDKPNSNLDIWSIQNRSEETLLALDNIQDKGTVILFSNLESEFIIDGVTINKKFETVLWVKQEIQEADRVEKNGRLIKFMSGSTFSTDTLITDQLSYKKGDILDYTTIKKILDAKVIKYIELVSKQPKKEESIKEDNTPEIWTARFLEVLESGISPDTKKEAIIYPDTTGVFKLKYYETEETGFIIDQIDFKGSVVFSDMVGLLVDHSKVELDKWRKDTSQIIRGGSITYTNYRPINIENVKTMLSNKGFNIEQRYDTPLFLNNEDQKAK